MVWEEVIYSAIFEHPEVFTPPTIRAAKFLNTFLAEGFAKEFTNMLHVFVPSNEATGQLY